MHWKQSKIISMGQSSSVPGTKFESAQLIAKTDAKIVCLRS